MLAPHNWFRCLKRSPSYTSQQDPNHKIHMGVRAPFQPTSAKVRVLLPQFMGVPAAGSTPSE